MQITKFWVVTTPTKNSILVDILFEADMKRMQLQFAGGLKYSEIIGVYTTKKEAEAIAKKALSKK